MPWHPDVPDFPLDKPPEIEKLEKLPLSSLNAMTIVEAEERIRDAAEGLAKSYTKRSGSKGTYDECVLVVTGALQETGSAINGKMGSLMVGISEHSAKDACRKFYPESPFPNELEY